MAATLSVVALGEVGRNLLDVAALAASSTYELATVIDPSLAEPKYAFNPGRSQHHAASIVRKLGQSHLRPGRQLVLAVAPIDLFDPDTEFVFGDGDSHLNAAVIGLFRIRSSDEERVARRISALSIWAVGLSLGLRDCEDSRCAMAVPRMPEELDRRNGVLCGPCRILLARGGQL